jgi:hypothetical protein
VGKVFSSISKIFIGAMLLLTFVNFSSMTPMAYAAPGDQCQDFDKTILGIPTWYKYLEGEEVEGKCRPIISSVDDDGKKSFDNALPIGLAVLEIGLTLAGLVAVVMVFVGSFKYILTLGEPDKATAARKTVINALIGLAITLVAARVVSFIASRIG